MGLAFVFAAGRPGLFPLDRDRPRSYHPRMENRMRCVSIKFPRDVEAELSRRAVRRNVTLGHLVREFVGKALNLPKDEWHGAWVRRRAEDIRRK